MTDIEVISLEAIRAQTIDAIKQIDETIEIFKSDCLEVGGDIYKMVGPSGGMPFYFQMIHTKLEALALIARIDTKE